MWQTVHPVALAILQFFHVTRALVQILISACLTCVCTAHINKIIMRTEDPMFTSQSDGLTASDMDTWTKHNTSRVIKMIIAAAPNSRWSLSVV